MSGGRLPPSHNAFSVGQQQPYLNHGGVNSFQSSQNHGEFVQPDKKGLSQESQHMSIVNNQTQSVSQDMNPASKGKESSIDRLSFIKWSNVTRFSSEAMSISSWRLLNFLIVSTRIMWKC